MCVKVEYFSSTELGFFQVNVIGGERNEGVSYRMGVVIVGCKEENKDENNG